MPDISNILQVIIEREEIKFEGDVVPGNINSNTEAQQYLATQLAEHVSQNYGYNPLKKDFSAGKLLTENDVSTLNSYLVKDYNAGFNAGDVLPMYTRAPNSNELSTLFSDIGGDLYRGSNNGTFRTVHKTDGSVNLNQAFEKNEKYSTGFMANFKRLNYQNRKMAVAAVLLGQRALDDGGNLLEITNQEMGGKINKIANNPENSTVFETPFQTFCVSEALNYSVKAANQSLFHIDDNGKITAFYLSFNLTRTQEEKIHTKTH